MEKENLIEGSYENMIEIMKIESLMYGYFEDGDKCGKYF